VHGGCVAEGVEGLLDGIVGGTDGSNHDLRYGLVGLGGWGRHFTHKHVTLSRNNKGGTITKRQQHNQQQQNHLGLPSPQRSPS
jgi:hypothetical protein